MSEGAHPHEIVIIKRHGGGHEDGHHGGAWKIAYADFVTAMMAFFLVMWLISANDKTKAVVARYFNPVQLVDSTPQPPGLSDPKKDANVAKPGTKPAPEGKEAPKEPPAKEGHAKEAPPKEAPPKEAPVKGPPKAGPSPESAEEKARKEEAEVLKNPYAVLADIAREAAPAHPAPAPKPQHPKPSAAVGAGLADAKGGEAFRDPFAPLTAAPAPGDAAAEPTAAAPAPPAAEPPDAAPHAAAPPAAAAPAAASGDVAEPAPPPLAASPKERAVALRNQIAALVKTTTGPLPAAEPKLDVKPTAEGLLIALTDSAGFSMFGSASARPAPQTVVLIERIGALLKAQKGGVVIRGFTDSRKFKSDTYDNWRLSAARAQMAHYMLVRGGLDDARIERIEGYADRQLRNTKDPESADNRRIEILVREVP